MDAIFTYLKGSCLILHLVRGLQESWVTISIYHHFCKISFEKWGMCLIIIHWFKKEWANLYELDSQFLEVIELFLHISKHDLEMWFRTLELFIESLFLRCYLFIHERQRERGRDTSRGRSRLLAGSLMWNLIPGFQDHTLG